MTTISHKFVELIPERLENGVLYVSITYCTAIHKCCCGCQEEVVTPLSPTDWKLTFDGKTVSLSPSIGNWSFACKSHYFIRNNKVEWAKKWSAKEIRTGRQQDQLNKTKYYAEITSPHKDIAERQSKVKDAKAGDRQTFLAKLKRWIS